MNRSAVDDGSLLIDGGDEVRAEVALRDRRQATGQQSVYG